MGSRVLLRILNVGDVYEGLLVVNKLSTGERCTSAGEGPCGEYYSLTLQPAVGDEGVKDIQQCDCCRRIIM
jgi:hypothetical protein